MKLYRVVAETDEGMAGGMSVFDLPGLTAPKQRMPKGMRFWYTARGWKAAKVAQFLAREGKGLRYTVKVVRVKRSDVYWTDGVQAVARIS